MARSAEEILNDDSVVSWQLVDAAKEVAGCDPQKALDAYIRRRRWEIHYGITIVADCTNNYSLKDQLHQVMIRLSR